VLLSVFASAAMAAPPKSAVGTETRIPFADHGGIYNWRVVDSRTVLIQGQDRRWYKAVLLSPCIDLPFAERIGFESNADGSFDKFSSIQVRDQNCPLVSLVETTAPPKAVKAKKPAAAATPPAS
jgi:hypothetical protein